MKIHYLTETDSTNAWLRRNGGGVEAVCAAAQTAGRGQRGNVWHSEPGANLLFSLRWLPEALPARNQFTLSEAVALAICEWLETLGVEARVKWPNDIYAADSKICGILIENAVGSRLESAIIGIGLNVNQTKFPTWLPNPVSMSSLTHKIYNIADLAESLAAHLESCLRRVDDPEERTRIHEKFKATMWRADGEPYPFREPDTGLIFQARIADVEREGYLILDDGTRLRRYAFKEVEFII